MHLLPFQRVETEYFLRAFEANARACISDAPRAAFNYPTGIQQSPVLSPRGISPNVRGGFLRENRKRPAAFPSNQSRRGSYGGVVAAVPSEKWFSEGRNNTARGGRSRKINGPIYGQPSLNKISAMSTHLPRVFHGPPSWREAIPLRGCWMSKGRDNDI